MGNVDGGNLLRRLPLSKAPPPQHTHTLFSIQQCHLFGVLMWEVVKGNDLPCNNLFSPVQYPLVRSKHTCGGLFRVRRRKVLGRWEVALFNAGRQNEALMNGFRIYAASAGSAGGASDISTTVRITWHTWAGLERAPSQRVCHRQRLRGYLTVRGTPSASATSELGCACAGSSFSCKCA